LYSVIYTFLQTPHKYRRNKLIMRKFTIALILIALVFVATAVSASVTFDAETGTGFVGKGDVQLIYGWNNQALQANAGDVQFQAMTSVESERSWICTNSNNENTQERERTTTTTTAGVVASIARMKNQVTGFILAGYSGAPVVTLTTDGPMLNSCPSGPWSLTTPAGDPVVISSSSSLAVSTNGVDWFPLP
jgi:hypothetical protein